MRASTEKLVNALTSQGDPKLAPLIERAKRDEFNDYFSDSATPIMDLVVELRKRGLNDLAELAIAGEFDGSRAEADEWAASPEGVQTFNDLVNGK